MKLLIPVLLLFFAVACVHSVQEQDETARREINSMVFACKTADSLLVLVQRFENAGNAYGQAVACRALGRLYREDSQFDLAIEWQERGLAIAEQLADRVEILLSLNQLGTNYRRIGLLPKASDLHYRALAVAEQLDTADNIVKKARSAALNGIGNIQMTLKNYDEALRVFRIALQGEIEASNELGQAINYANIGAIYEEEQQIDSARHYYQLSLEKNEECKSSLGISLCRQHFGRLAEREHNLAEARKNYQIAYDILEKSTDKWHWIESCISLSRINIAENNLAAAQNYLEKAARTAREINSIEHLSIVYELEYQFFLKQKNYRAALNSFMQSSSLADSVDNSENMTYIQNLRLNFEEEKNKRQIAEKQQIIERQKFQQNIAFTFLAVLAVILVLIMLSLHFRNRRNKILTEMNATKDKFFSIISHDLKNPVLAQRDAISLLLEHSGEWTAENIAKYYAELLKSADSLAELLYNLLNWAQVQTGRMAYKPATFDLTAELRNDIVLTENLAAKKGIDFQYIIPETAIVKADSNMLAIVVRNLLTNAVKFTEKGGKIILKIETAHNKTVISVSDTGIGMPPEMLKNLFKTDRQSVRKGTSGESSSGLGLAVSREMLEKHGSRLNAESAEGCGSKFWFEIAVISPDAYLKKGKKIS